MKFIKGDKVKIGNRYKPTENCNWKDKRFYPQPNNVCTITKTHGLYAKSKFDQFIEVAGYNGAFFAAYFIKA